MSCEMRRRRISGEEFRRAFSRLENECDRSASPSSKTRLRSSFACVTDATDVTDVTGVTDVTDVSLVTSGNACDVGTT